MRAELAAKMNLRALAAVSRFASAEETRYYLNGVKVEIEPRAMTYVATDGHRLFAHRIEKLSSEAEPDNDVIGEFIIPTAQCRLFKLRKGDAGDAELLEHEGELTLRAGDFGVVFNPIQGKFPDWRRVIPALPLAQGIAQFRGDYAASFLKASEELALGLPFVAHNGNDGPAIVRFGSAENTIGIIMPFRCDDLRTKPLPSWVSPLQAAE